MITRVEYEFDITKFFTAIRDATGNPGLRAMAAKAGTNTSTLSYLERKLHTPDMKTFLTICANLELNPGEYFIRTVWERQ